MPYAVHHIAILTRDLAGLERFYTEVLGLSVAERWDDVGIVFLDAGGLSIELTRQDAPDDGAQPPVLDMGVGMNHLAFRVDDVDIQIQELRAAGVKVLAAPADYKTLRTAFVADPDGNVLELVQNIGMGV